MLEKYLASFRAHERAIIIAVILGFGAHMYGRWIDLQSSKDNAKVAALTAVIAQDKVSVQNLAISAAQAQAAYQTTLDAITKQNSALEASVAQMAANLSRQQAVDKQMALPAVAQRIEVLVPATVGGVTATTAGVFMTDTASHGVLDVLEQVPVLKDQLKSETQVAQNNQAALDSASVVIVDKTAQVAGLNKSLIDQQAHEAASVAAEKVKTKKAFFKGLKYGFVAGFAAGAYIIHAL